MKWKLCLLVLLAFSLKGFGQDVMIVRGGMNISNTTGPSGSAEGLTQQSLIGFNGTLLGDFPINPFLHFLFGGSFDNKGFAIAGGGEIVDFEFNYIGVPLLLSFSPATKGEALHARYFVNAGWVPAVLVPNSPQIVAHGSGESRHEDLTTNTRFDLGFSGEVGAEIPVSSELAFDLGGGYTQGLVKQSFNDGAGDDGRVTFYNRVFTLFAGVKFAFEK